METASDETLVDENGDGVGEIAVGRLPARTLADAQLLLAKTLAYRADNSRGAVFVADNPDGYDFAATNQALRQALPEGMPAREILRGGRPAETVRGEIVNALNAGPALVTYAGHGSVEVWTGQGILRAEDVYGLTNGGRLPVVMSLSCLNGYFQDLHTQSLGESLLLAPNGGAAAVWASTGLTNPEGQRQLGAAFVQQAYGAGIRLGDAARNAKAATPDGEIRRTWVLLGDPTLPLR